MGDPLELDISTPQGDKIKMGLDNAWRGCRDDPKNRMAEVRRHVDALSRHLSAKRKPRATPTRKQVVPLIKSSEYMAQIQAQTGGQMKPAAERLAGDIWIVYALDMPDRVVVLSVAQARTLARTPAELRRLALTNLRRLLKEVKHHGNGPIYLVTAGGMYESSMLLLDEFWPAQAQSVAGDVVAAVPNRDILLFTGSRSSAGMANICKLVNKDGPYQISRTLLVRRGGAWKVLRSCSGTK